MSHTHGHGHGHGHGGAGKATDLAAAAAKWAKFAPMTPKPYTPVEVKKCDELLRWAAETYPAEPLALEFLSRAAMYRYLITYDWSPDKCKAKLKEVIEYRREKIWPPGAPAAAAAATAAGAPLPAWTAKQCPVCKPPPYGSPPAADGTLPGAIGAGDVHCIACPCLDRFGRPLVYFNLSRLRDVTPKAVIQHLAALNEAVFAPDGDGQMLFFLDSRNFSLLGSGMGKELAMEFLNVFTQMYPERMGTLVLLEPPTLLEWIFTAIKPLMDASTARKVMTARTKDTDSLLGWLLEGEPEAREWLLKIMHGSPKTEPAVAPMPQAAATRTLWRVRKAREAETAAGHHAPAAAAAAAGAVDGHAAAAAAAGGGEPAHHAHHHAHHHHGHHNGHGHSDDAAAAAASHQPAGGHATAGHSSSGAGAHPAPAAAAAAAAGSDPALAHGHAHGHASGSGASASAPSSVHSPPSSSTLPRPGTVAARRAPGSGSSDASAGSASTSPTHGGSGAGGSGSSSSFVAFLASTKQRLSLSAAVTTSAGGTGPQRHHTHHGHHQQQHASPGHVTRGPSGSSASASSAGSATSPSGPSKH
jgi:hypothetical protein